MTRTFDIIRFWCGVLRAFRDVAAGRVQRICAPGKWRVWRDDAGLHLEIPGTTKGRSHGA